MLKRISGLLKVRTKGWGEYAVIGLLVMLSGAFILVINLRDDWRLSNNGITTTAIVIATEQTSSAALFRMRGITNKIYYEFQAENGNTYRSDKTVGDSFFEAIQGKTSIPVIYWRTDPNTSRIEDMSVFWLVILMFTVIATGAFFFFVSLSLAKRALKETNGLIFLQDKGIAQKANVVRHVRAVADDEEALYKLAWRDQNGKLGLSMTPKPKDALSAVGEQVTILCDPENTISPALSEEIAGIVSEIRGEDVRARTI